MSKYPDRHNSRNGYRKQPYVAIWPYDGRTVALCCFLQPFLPCACLGRFWGRWWWRISYQIFIIPNVGFKMAIANMKNHDDIGKKYILRRFSGHRQWTRCQIFIIQNGRVKMVVEKTSKCTIILVKICAQGFFRSMIMNPLSDFDNSK